MRPNKANVIKSVAYAQPRASGGGIRFAFTTHSGERFEFEWTTDAAPQIAMKLLQAWDAAAGKDKLPLPQLTSPIVIDGYQIREAAQPGMIYIALCPSPRVGIGVAMTTERANELSTDLAKAAAILGPPRKRRDLS